MITVLQAVARRDLLLARRRRVEMLLPLGFFIVAASLFPIGVGPEPQTLRQIGPGRLQYFAQVLHRTAELPLEAVRHDLAGGVYRCLTGYEDQRSNLDGRAERQVRDRCVGVAGVGDGELHGGL